MPDISFASFNPRSFEQFAQALATSVLGQGLLVFGDGPDGGREASFNGRVPYPSEADAWDGVIVMQAKFRLQPHGDGRDADWLVAQIAGEASRLNAAGRVPDYYIVVTNVRLSGVVGQERKGGQQKLEEAFDRHLRPLGARAMHVWHEEKIASLLDGQPALLRSYGAWLSSREVLAAVFEALADMVPDFGATMLRVLMRQMRENRATRLREAGHVEDAPTPLESVFVDLPYGVPFEGVDARMELMLEVRAVDDAPGLLSDLLALTSLKLDPSSVRQTFGHWTCAPPVRHLVVGGPGQGKSTITQFLGQVARARLLSDQPSVRLTAEVRPVLDAVRARMIEIGISIEGPRRYPMTIDLPAFADELSKAEKEGRTLSLLEYLADRISVWATAKVDVSVMRRWLRDYPWLLMLDGLDEVPPSGNRRQLLCAITDFWDEATPANADVAMVITTRPQGYNDDLDPILHMRHEMQRLDAQQALAYAGGLVGRRMHDVDRRERLLGRLKEAVENPGTAQLMTTPLQVAILFQLVDQGGSAPADRWTLFAEYLSVMVRREREKLGEAGRVVREHGLVIESMMRRAGLLLHVEAERSGGAQSHLTMERLQALARDVLEEDGHDGEIVDRWAAEITMAATDRLVFLEQRVEGRVEFEIRSLQEFMAAAELMEGGDEAVRERLRAIAGRNHWQHVYRIAASKAFFTRDAAKYRETIVNCHALIEAESAAARTTYRGGTLALELLADGVAAGQPRYRRMLVDQAANLMALGPDGMDARLVGVLGATGLAEASPFLEPRLAAHSARERLAAWTVLSSFIERRGDDADRLFSRHWPADPATRLELAAGLKPAEAGTEADDLLQSAFAQARPVCISRALSPHLDRNMGRVDPILTARLPYIRPIVGHPSGLPLDVGVLGRSSYHMRMKLVGIGGAELSNAFSFPDGSAWSDLSSISSFWRRPSIEALSSFVEAMASPGIVEDATQLHLPWPLSTALAIIRKGADRSELADEVRRGSFGTPSDWEKAEARWHAQGMSAEDLDLWRNGIFFDGRVADVGAPYAHELSLTMSERSDVEWLRRIVEAIPASVDAAPLDLMRRMVLFGLSERPGVDLSASEFRDILEGVGGKWRLSIRTLGALPFDVLRDAATIDMLTRIGERHGFMASSRAASISVEDAVELVRRRPAPGMFELLCAIFAGHPAELARAARLMADDPALLEADGGAPSVRLMRHLAGVEALSEALASIMSRSAEGVVRHALLALGNHAEIDEAARLEVLIALATRLAEGEYVQAEALAAIRRLLDQQTSSLGDPAAWSDMLLPSALLAMINRGGGD